MKYCASILVTLLLPAFTWSQTCDCGQKFALIKHEMETNYPGFADKVNPKTKAAYDKKTKEYTLLTAKTNNAAYCLIYLQQWLDFFKDGHVQLSSGKQSTQSDEELLQSRIKTTEMITISPEQIKQLRHSKIREEGIYYSPDSTYKIAIMRSKNDFRDFVGVMLESKTDMWKPGQVKLEMKKVNDSLYNTVLYYRDHSYRAHKYHFNGTFYDGGNWIKEGTPKEQVGDEGGMTYGYEAVQARKLSDSTFYIQIGTFNLSNATAIDSIFFAYETTLKTTPYLILDVRHNGGGGDAAYMPILSYIYTRPIRGIGNDIYATEDNMKRWGAYLNNPYLSEESKSEIRETLDSMKNNIGKFVIHATDDTFTLTKIEPYPKHVAILINHNCGSTTEEFLLAAHQSSKVTLMGEHTYGELDYSNVVEADLPCGDIGFYYPVTKTRRIKMGQGIDGKGIQPDIKLTNDKDWIKETQVYLEKKKNTHTSH